MILQAAVADVRPFADEPSRTRTYALRLSDGSSRTGARAGPLDDDPGTTDRRARL
ncbi:hypothetical protein [Halorubrum sp. Ib24]|uniref:hypothetical protein n=1 Tax=Halorubrum sp. Ib24 TaxID=1383850 RepID=UPI001303AE98|nr:hypothetical protein [Halorubrum sp. Ib24]